MSYGALPINAVGSRRVDAEKFLASFGYHTDRSGGAIRFEIVALATLAVRIVVPRRRAAAAAFFAKQCIKRV